MKYYLTKVAGLLTVVMLIGTFHAKACGPGFPNSLLSDGGHALLIAPRAHFQSEILRMKLLPPPHPARIATNGQARQTAQVDLADLRAALRESTMPDPQKTSLLRDYEATRAAIETYLAEMETWKQQVSATGNSNSSPLLKPLTVPQGLPGEFADYLRGSIAWHQQDAQEACNSWRALLLRPIHERQSRSTWAAFMLGKAYLESDPDKALEYFAMVRELAASGFSDNLGLAFSSLGWEARLHLNAKRYERAIGLYLRQASEDITAVQSLQIVAAAVLKEQDLSRFARNPQVQAVVTAYLISREWHQTLWPRPGRGPESDSEVEKSSSEEQTAESTESDEQPNPDDRPVIRWLVAMETAGITDADSAERLALAAYQAGEIDIAQRWINRSKQSPTSQWLQSKLYLREGRINEAARLLSKVAGTFPLDAQLPSRQKPGLATSLQVDDKGSGQQVLGELGALHLARREYVQALDALLRSGFWADSAYVAERVLTLDELKEYVDHSWPILPSTGENSENTTSTTSGSNAHASQDKILTKIRSLLGRRLTRSSRGTEAMPYFPADLQQKLSTLLAALAEAWDESQAKERRGLAFFEAAKLTRANGLRLLATEVEPDWAVWDGQFAEGGPTSADRAITNNPNALPLVSRDELRRVTQNGIVLEHRFHYRYVAADLAWAGSLLMPDDSDETARVLCLAGTWIKDRNPQEADRFYKALVRRCGNTELGRMADKRHWFPKIDNQGNVSANESPRTPPAELEVPSE